MFDILHAFAILDLHFTSWIQSGNENGDLKFKNFAVNK